MTIGERIRTRRKALNLTMQTIYERENIKTGNLSELERDKYLPSVQTLVALSRVLRCSIDWLLTGEEYQPPLSDSADCKVLKTEKSPACDDNPLEDDERDLLAMYRLLPPHEREDAYDLIHFKYRKHVEKKKDSIYWTYKADKVKRTLTGGGSASGSESESGGGIA